MLYFTCTSMLGVSINDARLNKCNYMYITFSSMGVAELALISLQCAL